MFLRCAKQDHLPACGCARQPASNLLIGFFAVRRSHGRTDKPPPAIISGIGSQWIDGIGHNSNMATFFIEQFGCRATQADAAAIERQLRDRGYLASADASSADVVVVNTCTVTASADLQARQAIHAIHQRESSGANCGHGMLRPARAGRARRAQGRRVGGRKFAQAGNSAPDRGNDAGFRHSTRRRDLSLWRQSRSNRFRSSKARRKF